MAIVAITGLVAATACGDDDDRVLRVFAASSLTEAFTDLAERFETDHPDIDVEMIFAGSSTLAAQVADGAPVDVVATADVDTMDRILATGRPVGEPVTFATNRLVLAVAEGNPASVTGLDDLAARGLTLAVCAPEVPCGAYAARALAATALEPVTFERSVRGVVTKVQLGEVDAGIVYRTDVVAVDELDAVPLPEADDIDVDYPIVTVEGSAPGAAFVETVTGDVGQEVLAARGFELP